MESGFCGADIRAAFSRRVKETSQTTTSRKKGRMEYKDYYKILGVDKQADEKAIKKAYRDLARRYHPDRNPGDNSAEEKFKEINEAYEVIGNAENRAKYDQLGSNYHRYQQMGGAPGGFDYGQWGGYGNAQTINFEDLNDLFGGGASMGGDGGFSDFFRTFFSGGRGSRVNAQPLHRDLEQEIEISLDEAYHGTTRVLVSEDGSRIKAAIPKGARTGTKIRLRGRGIEGGDLYLIVKVLTHPVFKRQGNNLHSTVAVDHLTAILGGQVKVPTMRGPVNLKIPAGTQSGRKFRLSGRGMPHLKRADEFGDLLVTVEIHVPTTLSEEERALYKQLAELSTTGGT